MIADEKFSARSSHYVEVQFPELANEENKLT